MHGCGSIARIVCMMLSFVCVANLVQLVCCWVLLFHSAREREIKVHNDSGDKRAADWYRPVIQSQRHTVKETEAYIFVLRKTPNRWISRITLLPPPWITRVMFCHINSNNHGKIALPKKKKKSVKLYLTGLFQSWQVLPRPAGLRRLSRVIWERRIDPARAHLTWCTLYESPRFF